MKRNEYTLVHAPPRLSLDHIHEKTSRMDVYPFGSTDCIRDFVDDGDSCRVGEE